MKGIRFYREYVHKDSVREREIAKDTGLAVFTDSARIDLTCYSNPYLVYDCAGYLTDHRNSGVCMTSCGDEYLHDKCRRITEKQARALFPELIAYLGES